MNNGSKGKVFRGLGFTELERPKDARSEPGEGAVSAGSGTPAAVEPPDPQVLEKSPKRKFSIDYKARIVREADACTEVGQIGALLRREGLYSSQLAQWRRAYRKGALAALRDDKRGRKQTRHPLEKENEKLKKENARLERRLEQAQVIIDVQKKLSGLLGIPLATEGSEEND